MTDLAPPTRVAGRVLIVGISDASGSTGIQAAIKSASALGAFASAAVSGIVADETSVAVPPAAVAAQMQAVLADIGADVVVIGAIADAATIQGVADVLEGEARGIPMVLDLDGDTNSTLAPLARIVVTAFDAAADARKEKAASLAGSGRAALVTSASGDVLADGATVSAFPTRRGADRPVRGAGMSLAAAIGAGLAQGLPLAAAVRRARDYIEEAVVTAPEFGRGASPLNHVHTMRQTPAARFEP